MKHYEDGLHNRPYTGTCQQDWQSYCKGVEDRKGQERWAKIQADNEKMDIESRAESAKRKPVDPNDYSMLSLVSFVLFIVMSFFFLRWYLDISNAKYSSGLEHTWKLFILGGLTIGANLLLINSRFSGKLKFMSLLNIFVAIANLTWLVLIIYHLSQNKTDLGSTFVSRILDAKLPIIIIILFLINNVIPRHSVEDKKDKMPDQDRSLFEHE